MHPAEKGNTQFIHPQPAHVEKTNESGSMLREAIDLILRLPSLLSDTLGPLYQVVELILLERLLFDTKLQPPNVNEPSLEGCPKAHPPSSSPPHACLPSPK